MHRVFIVLPLELLGIRRPLHVVSPPLVLSSQVPEWLAASSGYLLSDVPAGEQPRFGPFSCKPGNTARAVSLCP